MPKTLYLTIDDAPSTDCINKLDFLDEHNIKAVWFTEGQRIEALFESAIEILKHGHILGNHAYSHPHFSEISVEACCEEITKTHQIVERVYEAAEVERNSRYFRFPYGDKGGSLFGTVSDSSSENDKERHTAIQTHLRTLGYTQPTWEDVTYTDFKEAGLDKEADWFWTYDSLDWSPYVEHSLDDADSPAKVLARLDIDAPDNKLGINYPGSADIVLVHDHITPDNLFQQIVEKLLSKDVVFKLPASHL